MDAELQAQLAHIIALLNGLDRKLDDIDRHFDRKLDDLADQLGVEIIEAADD